MATPKLGTISLEEANTYIQTFITDYFATNRFPIKSVSIDAAPLRNYLNDNPEVSNVKIVLGERVNTDESKEITMILVGYDANGDYVLAGENQVLDQSAPCPSNCPLGKAGNDLIS